MVGCGSTVAPSGNANAAGAPQANVNILPFTGNRIFKAPTYSVSIVGLNTVSRSAVAKRGAAVTRGGSETLTITSGNGIFAAAPVTVTSTTKNADGSITIVGTATGTNSGSSTNVQTISQTYNLTIVINAAGTGAVLTIVAPGNVTINSALALTSKAGASPAVFSVNTVIATISDLGAKSAVTPVGKSRATTFNGMTLTVQSGDNVLATASTTTPVTYSALPVTLASATSTANGLLLTSATNTAAAADGHVYNVTVLISTDGSLVNVAASASGGANYTATALLESASGGDVRAGTYVGETVCKACHGDVDTQWHTTLHSTAWQTLVNAGQDSNTSCQPCHTLGYGQPSGFSSYAATPNLVNVQCEDCHGPGSAHVAAPSASNITMEVDPATCGGCHTSAEHPTYNEYETSKHANSQKDSSQDLCTQCHSTEGFLGQIGAATLNRGSKQAVPPVPTTTPTFTQATLNIVCWACHDPHSATPDGYTAPIGHQLRLPPKKLCETCHRLDSGSILDSLAVTSSPRHGAGDIFDGLLGLKANGAAGGAKAVAGTDFPNDAHQAVAPLGCATCHVYQMTVTDPTEGNPNVTGHTFWPNLLACTQSGCHTPTGTTISAATITALETEQAAEGTAFQVLATGADQAAANLMIGTSGVTDIAPGTATINGVANQPLGIAGVGAQVQVNGLIAKIKPYLTTGNALYINQATLNATQLNNYQVAVWDYNMVVNMDPSLGVHNLNFDLYLLDTALAILKSLP
jgi:hypothetical protein